MLERLSDADAEPVMLAELRGSGIDFPATIASELELNGYSIQRVYENGRLVGFRLLQPERGEAAPRRWRSRRSSGRRHSR